MNIYTATNDFYGSICELFSEHGDVKILPETPEEWKSLKIDLLIFTGGEDIEPERYGTTDKSIRFNSKRDYREFSIFAKILRRSINVNKVLGICRGLQLMNVGMGGTLITDIYSKFGEDHDHIHPLEWLAKSPMSILKETNSLHHQGILASYIGNMSSAEILAVEPRTKVVEVIKWTNKFLGVQFHPEFFPEGHMRNELANIIASWCQEDIPLSSSKSADKAGNQKVQDGLRENSISEAESRLFTPTWEISPPSIRWGGGTFSEIHVETSSDETEESDDYEEIEEELEEE